MNQSFSILNWNMPIFQFLDGLSLFHQLRSSRLSSIIMLLSYQFLEQGCVSRHPCWGKPEQPSPDLRERRGSFHSHIQKRSYQQVSKMMEVIELWLNLMCLSLFHSQDSGDNSILEEGPTSIVWAIGQLAKGTLSGQREKGRPQRIKKEPSFHHTYPKQHVQVFTFDMISGN